MGTLYETKESILNALTGDNRIFGVVQFPLERFVEDLDSGNEYLHSEIGNLLVGKDYVGYLSDIHYRLIRANPEKQQLLIEVDASMEDILNPTPSINTLH